MSDPLAEFTDYDELRRALNQVREIRDISLERLDEITGASPYYFAHLLGPRPTKRLGLQSLGWALGGLGVKGLLVTDQEALARVQGRYQARDAAHLKSVQQGIAGSRRPKWLFTSKTASEMAKKRMSKLSDAQRKRLARKAGKASAKARRIKRRQQEARA